MSLLSFPESGVSVLKSCVKLRVIPGFLRLLSLTLSYNLGRMPGWTVILGDFYAALISFVSLFLSFELSTTSIGDLGDLFTLGLVVTIGLKGVAVVVF